MTITGLRSLLGALIFVFYRKSIKIEFTKGNVLGALCLATTIILFVFANKLTTAAAAILLQFTAPIFIIVLELIFYKKKPKVSEAVAVCVTIAGMLLFFADHLEGGTLLGNLLAIASGITFAGVFVCNKRPDTKPEQSIFLGFLINVVIGIPFAFFGVTSDPIAWGAILVLGIVQVGVAYVFFSMGIKRTAALTACLITALEPVLNPLWVALVTHEVPSIFAIIGGIIIVLTVIFLNIWSGKQLAKEPLTKSAKLHR
jgi:drug/metabolite transporter (DMT)-like permease